MQSFGGHMSPVKPLVVEAKIQTYVWTVWASKCVNSEEPKYSVTYLILFKVRWVTALGLAIVS